MEADEQQDFERKSETRGFGRPRRVLTKIQALDYEVLSSWVAPWIGFAWGQELLCKYFAWKVSRKYGRYKKSANDQIRLAHLKTSVLVVPMFILLLSGCTKEATETTQNGNFTIDFLFEQDGCRMYRFSDSGRYIYWTNCQGKVNSDYSTKAGKSRVTHRVEAITTEQSK